MQNEKSEIKGKHRTNALLVKGNLHFVTLIHMENIPIVVVDLITWIYLINLVRADRGIEKIIL